MATAGSPPETEPSEEEDVLGLCDYQEEHAALPYTGPGRSIREVSHMENRKDRWPLNSDVEVHSLAPVRAIPAPLVKEENPEKPAVAKGDAATATTAPAATEASGSGKPGSSSSSKGAPTPTGRMGASSKKGDSSREPKSVPATSWAWRPVRQHGSRAGRGSSPEGGEDNHLMHWARDPRRDHKHARRDAHRRGFQSFVKKIRMLEYNDEEYEMFLQDAEWTKRQTDRLFWLCQEYDLRFLVVHDRYNNWDSQADDFITTAGHYRKPDPRQMRRMRGNGTSAVSAPSAGRKSGGAREKSATQEAPRTLEELKDRFYAIQRTLLKARNGSDPKLSSHPMFVYDYDVEYEAYRRRQMDLLLKRKRRDEVAIAKTVLDARSLHREIRQVKRILVEEHNVKASVARAGSTNEAPRSHKSHKKQSAAHRRERNRNRERERERQRQLAAAGAHSPSAGRGGSSPKPSNMSSPASRAKETSFEVEDTVMEEEIHAEGVKAPVPESVKALSRDIFKAPSAGVSLRSQQLSQTLQLSGRQSKQLEHELITLCGLTATDPQGHKKPKLFQVPTRVVCNMYDQLRSDIITSINLRKHVQKQEAVRDNLKSMLRAQNKTFALKKMPTKKDSKRKAPSSQQGSGSHKRRKT